MLVIAFDGILFDTLEFRANAVVEALAAEGVLTSRQHVLSILPLHSLAEAVRAAVLDSHADETLLDLAALRAERAIGALGSRGAVLNVGVRDRLVRAAAVTRIVVRADSRRHEVDELLRLAELDSVVSFVRCSDDLGEHAHLHTVARDRNLLNDGNTTAQANTDQSRQLPARLPTVERSYAHISRRLYSNATLFGTAGNIGVALEVDERGRAVARTYGFATPDASDAANLSGR